MKKFIDKWAKKIPCQHQGCGNINTTAIVDTWDKKTEFYCPDHLADFLKLPGYVLWTELKNQTNSAGKTDDDFDQPPQTNGNTANS